MLGVGTLFKYKYTHGSCEMIYGVITKRREQENLIEIQWFGGNGPYPISDLALLNLLKSGDEKSGIIYNTNERVNHN